MLSALAFALQAHLMIAGISELMNNHLRRQRIV